jgi:hypothetical protein
MEGALVGRHASTGKGCAGCHRIHPKEGTERKGADSRCVECHPKADRIFGTVHAELGGGACGGCHPAHGELPEAVVKRRPYEEVFKPNLPCLRCHQEGGMASLPALYEHPTKKKKVPTNYGGNVTLESVITMVGRLQEGGRVAFPLFADDGKPGVSGRVGCLTCHDPHAGTATSPGSRDRVAGKYLRDPSDTFIGEICGSCHRSDGEEHVRKFHTMPRKEEE